MQPMTPLFFHQRVIDEEVKPAFQKLKSFILDEYAQHLRASPGLGSLPNGQEMYKVRL